MGSMQLMRAARWSKYLLLVVTCSLILASQEDALAADPAAPRLVSFGPGTPEFWCYQGIPMNPGYQGENSGGSAMHGTHRPTAYISALANRGLFEVQLRRVGPQNEPTLGQVGRDGRFYPLKGPHNYIMHTNGQFFAWRVTTVYDGLVLGFGKTFVHHSSLAPDRPGRTVAAAGDYFPGTAGPRGGTSGVPVLGDQSGHYHGPGSREGGLRQHQQNLAHAIKNAPVVKATECGPARPLPSTVFFTQLPVNPVALAFGVVEAAEEDGMLPENSTLVIGGGALVVGALKYGPKMTAQAAAPALVGFTVGDIVENKAQPYMNPDRAEQCGALARYGSSVLTGAGVGTIGGGPVGGVAGAFVALGVNVTRDVGHLAYYTCSFTYQYFFDNPYE